MKRRWIRAGWILPFVLTLLPEAMAAQQARWYRNGGDRVRELSGAIAAQPGMAVQVAALAGTIRVHGVGGSEVRYTIRIRLPAGGESPARTNARLATWPIQIERQGETLVLSTGVPAPGMPAGELSVDVGVPAEIRQVRASTAMGDVNADQLDVPVVLDTRAGNINADAVRSPLQATSLAGDIVIGRAGAIRAQTAGAIHVARADGAATLTTHGGAVTLGEATGPVNVESFGGAIDLGSINGRLVATSRGGNIHLVEALEAARLETEVGNIVVDAAHNLECSTASGNIELTHLRGSIRALAGTGQIEAAFAPDARLSNSWLQSSQGGIVVSLPAAVGAMVVAQIRAANGHSLRSDYPALVSVMQIGPRLVSARASLNGGGPILQLVSSDSDITVRKP